MQRYHAERTLMRKRASLRRMSDVASGLPSVAEPPAGRFRKALRCGGCRRTRCQLCHYEKFPKRIPTRREIQTASDLEDATGAVGDDS